MIIKNQYLKHIVGITVVFSLIIFGVVTVMNWKNTHDLQDILEDSVESQLISIAYAAQEMIDVDAFISYNSEADKDADIEHYNETLNSLRQLGKNVKAEYIYALKKLDDGTTVFVFDTDTEDPEVFIEYETGEIHEQAFRGEDVAGILNLTDEYGSYNTGAIPIWDDNKVVGVIGVDLEDHHIMAANTQARINMVILSVMLIITLGIMILGMHNLTKQIKKMKAKLERDAHYDTVTGLPNRKYLMEYLDQSIQLHPKTSFALLFIDLDNFKSVNDNAGHDAGDELLRHIAEYLDSAIANSKAFRPSAGQLNIAARVGGDEFIQIIQNIDTEEQAAEAANILLDGFKNQNFDRYIKKFNVGMSIGIALYPYHAENFHVLIKYADIAMYHSKRGGKNTYTFYNDTLPHNVED